MAQVKEVELDYNVAMHTEAVGSASNMMIEQSLYNNP